jgi:hypothetical protein
LEVNATENSRPSLTKGLDSGQAKTMQGMVSTLPQLSGAHDAPPSRGGEEPSCSSGPCSIWLCVCRL